MGAVRVDREGPVATLTLARADRHNSLVPELLDELSARLDALATDPGVRAVVLAASGRSFSTGGDVARFHAERDDLAAYADRVVGALNRTVLDIVSLPQPVVAAVHGAVTGGSIGLVLAADVVLVGPEASFTPWYREVGFSPDGGWTAILPELVGHARAADALLTNRTITAEDAVAWGLAARLVPEPRLAAEAASVAARIATGVPGSIRHTKRLLRDPRRLREGLDRERRAFLEQVVTAEALEGMRRYLGVDQ